MKTILFGLAALCAAAPAAQLRAQSFLEAQLHEIPNPLHPQHAHATAEFELSADQKFLYYRLEFMGLDLEPIPANRTDPNDVIGIHLHLIVPDVIGPHILNIFGTPSEDDADLVVDYAHDKLRGTFDVTDASRDPVTHELLPQFFPLTTKIIDDWTDEILANQTYLAVHTAGENGGPLMHGDVVQLPEPATALLAGCYLAATRFASGSKRRPRRQ